MFYKMLMVLLTVVSIGLPNEPETGKWRWAEDTLQPTEDKQVHAVGSFGLYYLFTSKGMTKGNAVNTVVWLGLFKEYLDALVPWEKYGNWGGDGWSNADLVANFAGVGSAYIIDRLWEKKGHENISTYITVRPECIRVSLYFNWKVCRISK